jgi:membrane protease YdiL (CAAX protease family)
MPTTMPAAVDTDAGRPRALEERIELVVFLVLIVPSLLLSFVPGAQGGLSFSLLAASVMARDLALVALVVFFLWKNREPLRRIGWTFRHGVRELAVGAALFVPFQAGAAGLELALRRIGLSVPRHLSVDLQPSGGLQRVLAVLLVVVVAVAEETIFRGYLLLRLKAWTRSAFATVALASLVFAIGHGYEGSAGVVTVAAMGAGLALVYLWRKSLIAAVTVHFLVDFTGIVLVPLLGRG